MLPEAEVHVWLVPVAIPAQSCAVLQSFLDDDECERARRFRTRAARERFVVSRGALRLVLGGLTGSSPERLRFARRCGWCGGTDHGKPHLLGHSGLDFSISHSGGLALIAVGRMPMRVVPGDLICLKVLELVGNRLVDLVVKLREVWIRLRCERRGARAGDASPSVTASARTTSASRSC